MAKRNRSRNTRFEVRSYNEQERMSTTRRIVSYLRSLANRRSTGVVRPSAKGRAISTYTVA